MGMNILAAAPWPPLTSRSTWKTLSAASAGQGDKPATAARPQKDSSGKKDQGRKLRALVIDDTPEVADMLSFMLRSSGYEVVAVFSAPDALAAARQERFDIVVSDIGMPGMNGYDLAIGLRRLPAYGAVPMIAVTGFSEYSDRKRALQSGFNAFLMKPIDPVSLVELIGGLTD